jgi:hypothetical protein
MVKKEAVSEILETALKVREGETSLAYTVWSGLEAAGASEPKRLSAQEIQSKRCDALPIGSLPPLVRLTKPYPSDRS